MQTQKEMLVNYNKQQVILAIGKLIIEEQEKLKESKYPASYHNAKLELLRILARKAANMEFINFKPEHNWFYFVYTDAFGARIELIYAKIDDQGYKVQKLIFAEAKARLLSADAYGERYDVPGNTVRQWIRRGKLPTASREGTNWMIPELAIVKKRGYAPRNYEWDRVECSFEEDMKFLQEYDGVRLEQLGSNQYGISLLQRDELGYLVNKGDGVKLDGKLIMSKTERESFELRLLENTNVKYCNFKIDYNK